jgi:nicotinate dehydrogenase subunit B
LTAGALASDSTQSNLWNRGRYLVEGLGHCSACHSPRNAVGAETGKNEHLTGGWADNWEVPGLTQRARAPVPWDKHEFYAYLRTGYSSLHGSAAGPMAPVIEELMGLPDQDIDAMATYLAAFNQPGSQRERQAMAAAVEQRAANAMAISTGTAGARIYQGACAVCHQGGDRPDVFGISPSLALNSNLHSDGADNLVRVILEGVSTHAAGRNGAMPAFRTHFDDAQIGELVRYLRNTFAPDKPMWSDIQPTISRIRAQGSAPRS